MENQEEKIILRVELSQDSAQQQLEETAKKLLANKEAVAALNKEYKASQKDMTVYNQLTAALGEELKSGKISTEQHAKSVADLDKQYAGAKKSVDDYARESTKLRIESKSLNDEQRALLKSMDNVKQQHQQAAGSVNQLRAQLADLTKAYNSLSKEERESGKAGKEIQKQAKATSDELKKLESRIGDDRRSVGSYKDSILEAIKGNTGFGKSIDGVSTAMKANPIGFFVGLLVSLLSTVLKLQPVMNAIEQATNAFNAAVEVVTGRIASLIQNIRDGAGVLESFGRFFGGMGTEMANAAKEGASVTKALQDIGDAERALAVEVAQAQNSVDELLIKAKNRTLSEAERLDLLKQAAKIETDINQKQIALAEKKVKAIEAQNKRLADQKTLNDENEQQLADAQVALANLQGQSNQLLERIGNRTDQLIQEGEAKRQAALDKRIAANEKAAKADEERRKKATELELREMKAAAEYRVLQAEKGSQEELEARVKVLQVEAEISLRNVNLTASERVLITDKALKAELELRREFTLKALAEAQKLIDLEKQQKAEFEQRTDKEFADQQKATAEHFDTLTLKATQQYAAGLINEQQYQDQLEQIKRDALQKQLKDVEDYGKSTVAVQQAIAEEEIKAAQRVADEKVKIKQAELQVMDNVLNAAGALVSLAAKKESDAADFQKALAVFQIGIDTAQAFSTMVVKATASGVTPIDIAVQISAGIATVLANINQARKLLSGDAPKPSFRQGTVLEGPSHEAGGIDLYSKSGHYYGEAEGGEIVLTKGVKRDPLLFKIASLLNVAAGGKPLTPAAYLQDGGIMQQGSARVGMEIEQDRRARRDMARETARELAKVVPRSIAVTQIEEAQRTKAKIRQGGRLT